MPALAAGSHVLKAKPIQTRLMVCGVLSRLRRLCPNLNGWTAANRVEYLYLLATGLTEAIRDCPV
jgi:hypothetical protein